MNDEHHGKGGSYIRDPKTGKRTLAQRTEEASVQMPAEPAGVTAEATSHAATEDPAEAKAGRKAKPIQPIEGTEP